MTTRLLWLTIVSAALATAATEAHFGPVTIAAFEDARLTAYCDGSVVPAPATTVSTDTTACAIQFEFHDITGRILKQGTLTLQASTGGTFDFIASRDAVGAGRITIDPCWTVLRGAAFASLEVFDILTQRTHILVNWGDRPTPQTGDVDFGMAGITPFDTGRLGVFCSDGDGSVVPAQACDVSFEFHDAAGRTVKASRMTLQPGATGFLDLTWAELGASGRRGEIEPCFTVARGAAVGSFAVLDNATGLTLAQGYPAARAQ